MGSLFVSVDIVSQEIQHVHLVLSEHLVMGETSHGKVCSILEPVVFKFEGLAAHILEEFLLCLV